MRSLDISKKVFKELLRDKRTLVMVFVAPIFIMWLMSVMFSSNSDNQVTVGVINVDSAVIKQLDSVDEVSIHTYTDEEEAEEALKNEDVSAIIKEESSQTYDIIYANYDASETALTKQIFSSSLLKVNMEQLATMIEQIASQNPNILKGLSDDFTGISNEDSTINLTENYVYGNKDTDFFSKMVPILIGFFVFFFVFLISGMALLKERTTGTLDRLLATPVKRSEIILGYMISYGILAIFQTFVIIGAAIFLLNIDIAGSILDIIIINSTLALVALTFGFLLSTLAESEFQMMQFIPLVIVPQVFFSGLIPLDSMGDWVNIVSKILPISYAGEALTDIIIKGKGFEVIWFNLTVLVVFAIVLTLLNIVGLKRYRKV